ncbi:MAG: hypothetical protein JNM80_05715 [Phycisphaerae bacterium]|nr:hypothetical protein [Phycisphaerae bacterium]
MEDRTMEGRALGMPGRDAAPVGPEAARAMYRHMLTGWVMDALELRRRGLDRPTRRDGADLPLGPSSMGRRAA